ncbi:MAG TPA: hypothetical protein PKL77_05905 [Candidatus Omnitrophota bacterium]|nr:hypothetical protein [Candidatus Omnitrophota bacterium]
MAVDKLKSVLIILIALVLISLSAASGVYYFLQQEKKKNTQLMEELEEVRTRQKISETRLEENKNQIVTLQTNLNEAQTHIEGLKGELQQEQTSKRDALALMDNLKADLEQQKKLRADLEKKLAVAQDDMKKVQAQVKELADKKSVLEVKVAELEQKAQQAIELGTVVVNPEEQGASGSSVRGTAKEKSSPAATKEKSKEKVKEPVKSVSQPKETTKVPAVSTQMETSSVQGGGKVLVINKDYNFVVINLGSKDGVSIGDIFSISHAGKYLGDVKVEKVHDTMAAAGFMTQGMRDKISEGDKVTLK